MDKLLAYYLADSGEYYLYSMFVIDAKSAVELYPDRWSLEAPTKKRAKIVDKRERTGFALDAADIFRAQGQRVGLTVGTRKVEPNGKS